MKSEIKFTGNPEVAYRILDSMHSYIDNVPKDRCVTIVITIEDEPLLDVKDNDKKQTSHPFKFCNFCESEYSNAYHYLQSVCFMPNPPIEFTQNLYKGVLAILSKRIVSQNDYAGADIFLQNELGINDYAAQKLCDFILDSDYELNCQQ